MIIRQANAQDIEQLVHLGRNLLEIHFLFDAPYYTLEENFSLLFSQWLQHQLFSPTQIIFVAQEDNTNEKKIIGFISGFIKALFPWFKVKSVGHISYLVVDEQFRNVHVGKKLEETLISWFLQKGVRYVEVYTDEKNTPAVAAWTSYGYGPFKKYLRKSI